MKTVNRTPKVLFIALPLLFTAAGCALAGQSARVGELVTWSESVALGDAESVKVSINMPAGELAVTGGADALLDARFTYNVEELAPMVEYSGGVLTVSAPEVHVGVGSLSDLDSYRNEWDLRLNDDVPMGMNVEMGAGTADLKLGDLSLTALDIQTGAGDATVDLSGDWQEGFDANVNSGVGQLSLKLPSGVCVRADVEGGLAEVSAHGLTKDGSTFVNEACGESDVTLRIEVSAGVGAVNLEVED